MADTYEQVLKITLDTRDADQGLAALGRRLSDAKGDLGDIAKKWSVGIDDKASKPLDSITKAAEEAGKPVEIAASVADAASGTLDDIASAATSMPDAEIAAEVTGSADGDLDDLSTAASSMPNAEILATVDDQASPVLDALADKAESAASAASGAFGGLAGGGGGGLGGLGGILQSAVGGMSQLGMATFGVGAVVGGANAAIKGLGIEGAAKLQETQVRLQAMTGSAEAAQNILNQAAAAAQGTRYGAGEMRDAASVMVGASQATGTSMEEMLNMSKLLAAAKPGASIQEASAAVAALAGGAPASRIARTFGLPLSMVKELEEAGIEGLDGFNEALGRMGITQDLVAAQANTFDGQMAKLNRTVGALQMAMARGIFEGVMEVLPVLLSSLDKVMPALTRIATLFGKTLGGALKLVARILGAVLVPAFDIVGTVLGKVADAIEVVQGWLGKLADTAAVRAIQDLGRRLSENEPLMRGLGAAVLALVGILAGPAVIGAIGGLAAMIFGTLIPAFFAAAGAGFAMIAPFLPIIIAVGLVAAALTYLWRNNEGFRNFVISAWDGIKQRLQPVFDWLQKAWEGLGDIWRALTEAFTGDAGAMGVVYDVLRDVFGDGVADFLQPFLQFIMVMIEPIRAFASTLGSVFQSVNAALSSLFQGDWTGFAEHLGQAFGDLIEGIRVLALEIGIALFDGLRAAFPQLEGVFNLFQNLFAIAVNTWATILQNFVGLVFALFRGDWSAAWGFAVSIVQAIVSGITDTFNAIWAAFVAFASMLATAIVSAATTWAQNMLAAGKSMLQSLLSGLQSMWSNLWSWLTNDLPNGISNALKALPPLMLQAGKDALQGLIDGMWSIASGIGDWIKRNVTDAIPGFIKQFLGINSPSTVLADIGSNIMQGFLNGLTSKLPDIQSFLGRLGGMVGGIGGMIAGAVNAPGNVTDWLNQAIAATGVPSSWLPGLQIIAMNESSGDPNAGNFWDVNAQRGDPSLGLMQTIGATFRAYAQPGRNNILNPVDNAIAAIRYIQARYGDITSVPGVASVSAGGPYRPYDQGGWLPPGITTVGNFTGQAERVLAPGQSGGVTLNLGGVTINAPGGDAASLRAAIPQLAEELLDYITPNLELALQNMV